VSWQREWGSIFLWGWRASRRLLLLSAALLLIVAIASIVYPVGLAIVINSARHHHSGQLIFGVALVAVFYTVTWAGSMFSGVEISRFAQTTTGYLTARVAETLHAVSGIDHLERPEYRTELDILQENLGLLGGGARQLLVVAQVLLRTLVIIVILALIYAPLALLPLVAIAPVVGERLSVDLRQRVEERVAPKRRLADELFELASSSGPAKELRVFGAVAPLRALHAELAAEITGEVNRATVRGTLYGVTGWLVFGAAFVAGIALVAIRAAHGQASVGQVVLAVTLVQRVQYQVGQAAASVGQLLTTARHARRLLWLEDYAAAERRELAARAQAGVPDTLRDGIVLERVGFAYPPGEPSVLADLDLTLPAGSAVALVGENGAGKTTLVKLLTGMYQPTAGRILLDGTPLTAIDPAAWRTRTAATFQDFVEFELLAREVVGIGDLDHMEDLEAIGAALQRADAEAVIEQLRSGLGTPVGNSFEEGQQLSGGQWQRLALARGMMRPTPLLLVLDEPTASLDAITEARLFDRYLAARAKARQTGAITVLVSHRFSTVRMADLIVVLEQGRITEHGTHQQLMAAGGLYAQLYEMQARAYR
jgi:ATP-binding cassette subfamily B protein